VVSWLFLVVCLVVILPCAVCERALRCKDGEGRASVRVLGFGGPSSWWRGGGGSQDGVVGRKGKGISPCPPRMALLVCALYAVTYRGSLTFAALCGECMKCVGYRCGGAEGREKQISMPRAMGECVVRRDVEQRLLSVRKRKADARVRFRRWK